MVDFDSQLMGECFWKSSLMSKVIPGGSPWCLGPPRGVHPCVTNGWNLAHPGRCGLTCKEVGSVDQDLFLSLSEGEKAGARGTCYTYIYIHTWFILFTCWWNWIFLGSYFNCQFNKRECSPLAESDVYPLVYHPVRTVRSWKEVQLYDASRAPPLNFVNIGRRLGTRWDWNVHWFPCGFALQEWTFPIVFKKMFWLFRRSTEGVDVPNNIWMHIVIVCDTDILAYNLRTGNNC